MTTQANLFGEPALDASKSQFFTPPWLARRVVEWVHPTARVIEPSAGSGNLVDALVRLGHLASRITAVELDPRWHAFLAEKHTGTLGALLLGDFLALPFAHGFFDVVLTNPPYENNLHTQFVTKALELAPVVIGVFPISFEYTKDRDAMLWATKGKVTRRARLPERVDFGGTEASGMSDHVVLQIERRHAPRMPRETCAVLEETWLKREGEAA